MFASRKPGVDVRTLRIVVVATLALLAGCTDAPEATSLEPRLPGAARGARASLVEDECTVVLPPAPPPAPGASPSASPTASPSSPPPPAPTFTWAIYADGDAIPTNGSALVTIGAGARLRERTFVVSNTTPSASTLTVWTSPSLRVVDLSSRVIVPPST